LLRDFTCSLREAAAVTDDLELLRAWQGGDKNLGNLLFRRHVVAVTRFFRTKVPDAAEDLTQMTFLALVEAATSYAGTATFRSFLFGIARNQLLMHFRKKQRSNARFDPLLQSARDGGAGPARMLCRHQQQTALTTALQQVPLETQLALELYYFEHMSVAEIAAATAEPQGTVKSRLARGRDLLRVQLEATMAPGELLTSTVSELDRWMGSLPEVVNDYQTQA
jgi:RNA polymerase sigma factor (sigma-70 family)